MNWPCFSAEGVCYQPVESRPGPSSSACYARALLYALSHCRWPREEQASDCVVNWNSNRSRQTGAINAISQSKSVLLPPSLGIKEVERAVGFHQALIKLPRGYNCMSPRTWKTTRRAAESMKYMDPSSALQLCAEIRCGQMTGNHSDSSPPLSSPESLSWLLGQSR